jgi:ABC-2 type transport system permease protein
VFIFLSLALGLLISSAVSTQSAALLISGMALMMPVILLSGMMFPVENMPPFLQVISDVIPARWYIAAVKKLMIKGLGVASILKELAILSGMAIFILAASLKRFKVRLE